MNSRINKISLRTIKKICEKCNSTYREAEEPKVITDTKNPNKDGSFSRHEEEFFPYCEKCFKKEIKRYKKAQWISTMLQAKFIDDEFLKRYKDEKVSQKEIDDLWRKFNCQ